MRFLPDGAADNPDGPWPARRRAHARFVAAWRASSPPAPSREAGSYDRAFDQSNQGGRMRTTIVALLLLDPILACAAGFEGRWEGEIHIPGREVRMVLDLAPQP